VRADPPALELGLALVIAVNRARYVKLPFVHGPPGAGT